MSMFHISGVLLFANKDLIIMSCFSLLHMIQQGFYFRSLRWNMEEFFIRWKHICNKRNLRLQSIIELYDIKKQSYIKNEGWWRFWKFNRLWQFIVQRLQRCWHSDTIDCTHVLFICFILMKILMFFFKKYIYYYQCLINKFILKCLTLDIQNLVCLNRYQMVFINLLQ